MAVKWAFILAVVCSSAVLDSSALLCQLYTGETCAGYLSNQTVFVTPDLTMELIEERLKSAYGVISSSKYEIALCLLVQK